MVACLSCAITSDYIFMNLKLFYTNVEHTYLMFNTFRTLVVVDAPTFQVYIIIRTTKVKRSTKTGFYKLKKIIKKKRQHMHLIID